MVLSFATAAPARAQAAVTVDTAPALDIPGTGPSGRIHFELVAGATRLSNGNVVVADRAGSALQIFDRTGQPVRTIGRRGSGPGEFQRVDWLGQCGRDSLFVWDRVGQRLSVIDSTGRFVHQGRFPADTGVRGTPAALSCSQSGAMVLVTMAPIRPAAGAPFLERGQSNIVRMNNRGAPLRVIASVTGSERVAIDDAILPRPLGRTTIVGVGRDRIYVGTGDGASVFAYALHGALISTLGVGIPNRRLTRQEYDRAVDRMPPTAIQALWAPIRERLRLLPVPAVLPPYRRVFVDPRELLWAVVSPEGSPSTTLTVVDAAGRPRGGVILPRDVTVLSIDRDFILAAYADDADEPHVLAYRIRRTQ